MSNMTDVRQHSNGHAGPTIPTPHGPASSDFVSALSEAVRENPIPAALIGMGVLWLFMGGSNTSLFGGDGRRSLFRTTTRGAEQVGKLLGETAARVGSSVDQAAQAAARTTSDW